MNNSFFDKDKKYAFISYAHSDYDKVKEVLEKLAHDYNINIWWDNELTLGTSWFDEDVTEAIKNENCCCIIFFGSDNALTSKNCRAELELAANNSIRMIPVNFAGGRLSKRLSNINEVYGDESSKVETAEYIISRCFPDKITGVSISDDSLYDKIAKSFAKFSDTLVEKDSSKWIDVNFAYVGDYLREQDETIEEYGEYDPTGDETDARYLTKILAMFYCEAVNYKKKGKFSYFTDVENGGELKIMMYGNEQKEYTALSILEEARVYVPLYESDDDYEKYYYDAQDADTYEAVYYFAKILDVLGYIDSGMDMSSEKIAEEAKKFIGRHNELLSCEYEFEDLYPGQNVIVRKTLDPNAGDCGYSLFCDELLALCKSFWKKFVDNGNE